MCVLPCRLQLHEWGRVGLHRRELRRNRGLFLPKLPRWLQLLRRDSLAATLRTRHPLCCQCVLLHHLSYREAVSRSFADTRSLPQWLPLLCWLVPVRTLSGRQGLHGPYERTGLHQWDLLDRRRDVHNLPCWLPVPHHCRCAHAMSHGLDLRHRSDRVHAVPRRQRLLFWYRCELPLRVLQPHRCRRLQEMPCWVQVSLRLDCPHCMLSWYSLFFA